MDEIIFLKISFLSLNKKNTTFMLLISLNNFILIKIKNNFEFKNNKNNLINNFFY
jgi:hypothetical protein